MTDRSAQLTTDDLRLLAESLDYSVRRIEEYSHANSVHKETSLKPILALRTKVREMRDMSKLKAKVK